MDFSKTDKKLGSSGPIWYPASGFRFSSNGSLNFVCSHCSYWSVSPNGYNAYLLGFDIYGRVYPAGIYYRSRGQSVRCLQE